MRLRRVVSDRPLETKARSQALLINL